MAGSTARGARVSVEPSRALGASIGFHIGFLYGSYSGLGVQGFWRFIEGHLLEAQESGLDLLVAMLLSLSLFRIHCGPGGFNLWPGRLQYVKYASGP